MSLNRTSYESSISIFLDLDGIFTDFEAGVCDLFGFSPPCQPELATDYGGSLLKYLGITHKEMWHAINKDEKAFWSGLPEIDGSRYLAEAVTEMFGCFCFLTSPGISVKSPSEKAAWMESRYPEYPRIITLNKELVAGPNKILVDDHWRNCWKFTQAGGHAVLYPTQYNELAHLVRDRNNYTISELHRLQGRIVGSAP